MRGANLFTSDLLHWMWIVSAARSLTCRDDLDSKWRLLLADVWLLDFVNKTMKADTRNMNTDVRKQSSQCFDKRNRLKIKYCTNMYLLNNKYIYDVGYYPT